MHCTHAQPARMPLLPLQAAQSEAARESVLFRPAAFAALAPELLALYARATTLPGPSGVRGTPAAQRRRSSRGAGEHDEAAAAAAAEVAAEEAAAAAGDDLDAPFSAGAFSDAAPFSAGGWEEDRIDGEEAAAAATQPFGSGEEEEEGAAAHAARGALALQPVPSSGELGSIGAAPVGAVLHMVAI